MKVSGNRDFIRKRTMASSWYIFVAMLLCIAAVGLSDTPQTQEEIARRNLRKLARANNDMALNLYKEIASGTSDNFFFSSLSLSTVFGMLYYGSKGHTAEELRKVLGYEAAGLEEGLVHRTFQQYLTEVLPSQDNSSYVLNSANAILLDKHLDLIPSYKKNVQDFYKASVQDVDFLNDTPEIVDGINEWVKQKTNGKIDHLLKNLNPFSTLVLLNAVYFKGNWETQFDPADTEPGTFYNYGLESEAKQVPMMKLDNAFAVAFESDLRAIEIPYKGDNITMILLLPSERDGLESMEESLTLKKFVSIKYKMKKRRVYLTIPKFKIQYSKQMAGDFESLGAKSAFSPGADFSGITSTANVCVNQLIHKAVIEVNEEGSEASAASSIYLNRSGPLRFNVRHPFIFSILDKRNDMFLFTGRVTNL